MTCAVAVAPARPGARGLECGSSAPQPPQAPPGGSRAVVPSLGCAAPRSPSNSCTPPDVRHLDVASGALRQVAPPYLYPHVHLCLHLQHLSSISPPGPRTNAPPQHHQPRAAALEAPKCGSEATSYPGAALLQTNQRFKFGAGFMDGPPRIRISFFRAARIRIHTPTRIRRTPAPDDSGTRQPPGDPRAPP